MVKDDMDFVAGTTLQGNARYLVTSKTDGDHCYIYCRRASRHRDSSNKIYVARRNNNGELREHEHFDVADNVLEAYLVAERVVDFDGIARFYIFDAVQYGSYRFDEDLISRRKLIGEFIDSLPEELKDRFHKKEMWKVRQLNYVVGVALPRLPHKTDGLIFTPVYAKLNGAKLHGKHHDFDRKKKRSNEKDLPIYKWKPPQLQSVDFRITPGETKLEVAKGDSFVKVEGEELDANTVDLFLQKHSLSPLTEPFIGECVKINGTWHLERLRRDKVKPNALKTALSVIKSIENPVALQDLRAIALSARERTPAPPLVTPAGVDLDQGTVPAGETKQVQVEVERELRIGERKAHNTRVISISQTVYWNLNQSYARAVRDTVASQTLNGTTYRITLKDDGERAYSAKRKLYHVDRENYRESYALEWHGLAPFTFGKGRINFRDRKRVTFAGSWLQVDLTHVGGTYELEIEFVAGHSRGVKLGSRHFELMDRADGRLRLLLQDAEERLITSEEWDAFLHGHSELAFDAARRRAQEAHRARQEADRARQETKQQEPESPRAAYAPTSPYATYPIGDAAAAEDSPSTRMLGLRF